MQLFIKLCTLLSNKIVILSAAKDPLFARSAEVFRFIADTQT